MRRVSLVIVLIFLASCVSSPDRAKSRAWPKNDKECAARGGHMQSITFSSQGCVFPSKDNGKICSDSSECEGSCDAPSGSPAGWEGTGKCSVMGGPANSGNIMIKGKASGFFIFD